MMIPRDKRRAALIRAMERGARADSLSPAESYALSALVFLAEGRCPGTDEHHEGYGIAGLAISSLYCDRCIVEALTHAWESGKASR